MKRKYNKKLEITLTLMFMFVVILLIVYYNYKDFYGNYKNRGLFASVVNYEKDVNNYNNDFDMIISSDRNTMTKDFVIYNNNKYTVKYNIYLKPNNLMINNDNCSKSGSFRSDSRIQKVHSIVTHANPQIEDGQKE